MKTMLHIARDVATIITNELIAKGVPNISINTKHEGIFQIISIESDGNVEALIVSSVLSLVVETYGSTFTLDLNTLDTEHGKEVDQCVRNFALKAYRLRCYTKNDLSE